MKAIMQSKSPCVLYSFVLILIEVGTDQTASLLAPYSLQCWKLKTKIEELQKDIQKQQEQLQKEVTKSTNPQTGQNSHTEITEGASPHRTNNANKIAKPSDCQQKTKYSHQNSSRKKSSTKCEKCSRSPNREEGDGQLRNVASSPEEEDLKPLQKKVLVSLMFISARNLALSAELCDQEMRWRSEVCLHIHNSIWINTLLFCTVRDSDNLLQLTFNLQEPGNVTSLENLYQEISKYGDIYNNLDHQLEEYKLTQEFRQQTDIQEFSTNIITYQNSLSDLRVQIGHTVDHLTMKVSGDNQLVASTNNSTLLQMNLAHIFTETHHVSTKLHLLLEQWVCNCRSCLPARDPSRRCNISPAISNDMCM